MKILITSIIPNYKGETFINYDIDYKIMLTDNEKYALHGSIPWNNENIIMEEFRKEISDLVKSLK